MINKKQFFLFSILFLFLVSFSFFIVQNSLDPDFGWHLRTGELIMEKGVPHQDWYSHTMSNFPWIDHEWLIDVLIYKIYTIFGANILLLIFLSLYTLSFFIIKNPKQSFFDLFFPIIFGYCSTIGFLGIRPQLLTVLFVAILWRIVNNFLDKSSKLIYLLPVLFILWANLHAGFFAGIMILFVILTIELFKKIEINKKIKLFNFLNNFYIKKQSYFKILNLGLVSIVCLFSTLLNPYGIRIYEEVFRTVGDNFLRFHIQEWFPLIYTEFNPLIFIYIFSFFALLIIFWQKIDFHKIIFYLLFFFLTLSGLRYFLIFVILTIPDFGKLISYFKQEILPNLGKNFKSIPILLLTFAIFYT
jgi:hypothetical protein